MDDLQRIKDDEWLQSIRDSWRDRLEELYGVCAMCGGVLDINGECHQSHTTTMLFNPPTLPKITTDHKD